MRPLSFAFLVYAAGCIAPAHAQAIDASNTTSRILGNIPDGTPPPPQAPKPRFIVPADDIIDTKVHQQGGRKITVREIAPIALPPPPEAAPPVDITDQALQARIAERRARQPQHQFLYLGANVFRSGVSPARSRVHLWLFGKGEPVVFWSSADFALIAGIGSFVGSDGMNRSLMMSWGVEDAARKRELHARHGKEYVPPTIPDFPGANATFTIVSGNPDVEALTAIQSLHDLYNNEHARLLTAYQGRERARLQHEADLKANPPKPKDIVIDYWLTDSAAPTQTKGAAR